MARGYISKQTRRVYKSKPVQSRVHTYGKAGLQLYKDVRYLKGLINSELHYDYASYTGQVVDNAGVIYHLSAIGQGDTNSTRSGNTILPRYLTYCVKLINDNAPTDTVRFIIFRWKDNSTPLPADIFEDNSNPVYSPLNDNITGNVRDRQIDILKDEWVNLGTSSESNGSRFYKDTIDLNPPTKNIKDHIKYDNGVTTSPLGGIYMLFIGRRPTLTATTFEGSHKLSFHDN